MGEGKGEGTRYAWKPPIPAFPRKRGKENSLKDS